MNVNEAGLTVPSAVLFDESPIVTLAEGWLVSTIVKVACPPDSLVTKPEVGFTLIPATSSSRLVAETLKVCPLYFESVLEAVPFTLYA